ncbi:MAG TPA: MarC family protein [Vicinamibacteria bacterium]|nr:MarC family protein [Vicinamibacteria bacterium]
MSTADLALRAFVTFFVVVDPVGLSPMFLGIAGRRDAADRSRVARNAVLVALGILLAFAFGGAWLLGQLGISLDAFRVAGGILLFRIAVDMVFAHPERGTEEEAAEARERRDIAVFPLAIPLIAGPGALASAMILAGEARGNPTALAVVVGMIVLVLGMTWAAFAASTGIARVLGQTGVNVITRVGGILLAALAAQYVGDGLRALLFPA